MYKTGDLTQTYHDLKLALARSYESNKQGFDSNQTYAAIRKQAKAIRATVIEQTQELDSYTKTAYKESRPEHAQKLIAPKKAAYDEFLKGKLEEYTALIEAHYQKRIAALENRISTPPTADMLSTLQTLGMRDNVSQGEMVSLAKLYSDCYQALKVLADIATRHGLSLHIPIDYDALVEWTDTAREYLLQRGEQLGVLDKDLPYEGVAFYGDYPDTQRGRWGAIVRELDGNLFTAVNTPLEVTSPHVAIADEEKLLDELFKPVFDEYERFFNTHYADIGLEAGDQILTMEGGKYRSLALKRKYREIAGKSPELADMLKRSKFVQYMPEDMATQDTTEGK